MSSSSNSHLISSASTVAEEHLNNFRQLPYHIYFTNPYSPLPPILTTLNFSRFFQQLSVGIIPVSPPPQRLRLVPTGYHYRYVIDQDPLPSNTTVNNNPEDIPRPPSSSNSFSSLPDLIPISNNIETPTNSTIDHDSVPLHTVPPPLYYPNDRPPAYHTIRSRQLVLRRIRILERDASEVRIQIIEEHHRDIAEITSTTQGRLDHHDSILRDEIRLLEDSLEI